MSSGADAARQVRLAHITTVPVSLKFFDGQVDHIQRLGFSVVVISSPGDDLDRFAQKHQLSSWAIPMARKFSVTRDLVSVWKLWTAVRAIRPDIVHAHTPKAGLLGTFAARTAGVPVIMLSIFGLPQMTRTGLTAAILNMSTRVSVRLAHRVWCDSFSMRDYIVEHGLCPAHKVVVMGQGSASGVDAMGTFNPGRVSTTDGESARIHLGIPSCAPVIGFVGRITNDKGMRELAAAWRSIRQVCPDVHLLLIGPLEPEDPIRECDRELFATDPRVHLTGPQDAVAWYMCAMDLFVMPSYREGFGMSNIEAAAMELPVVSTRIPGCIDSVEDGVTGTLVPPRDAVALECAIRRYLDDPELRARHGRAGRARVLREFRQEVIWEAIHQEYVRLLAAKGIAVPFAATGAPP